MKMIPNNLYETVKSNAERKVFKLLKDIDMGQGWTAYHSLNVSEHIYKKWGEIDFVIVGPKGLVCLEVKGGGVEVKDDIWRFTNRYQKTERKKEGPFEQVKTAHFSLIKMFKDAGIFESLDQKINTGWGVIFPDIVWNQMSPEMPKEIISDERSTKDAKGFKKYLSRLFEYWINKGRRLPVVNHDDDVLKKIGHFIRPDFQTSPSLSNTTEVIFNQMVKHTEDQLDLIESFDENDRIICEGGAGTGKTLLAVHAVRKELFEQRKVLLVVISEIFSEYLKKQLIPSKELKICTFAELEKNYLQYEENKFDVLILDEAQDLMMPNNFDIFNNVINKGIEMGRWRFFMDSNAQAGIIGNFDQDTLDIYKKCSYQHKLIRNCRNTQEIIGEAESTTGAHIGKTFNESSGPKVFYCDIENQMNETEMLTKQLENLVDQNISFYDMAILSPVSRNKSCVSKLEVKWSKHIQTIDSNNIISEDNTISYSTIAEFKGLERKNIMLVDTEYFDLSEKSKSLLYIAMTRANINLWVANGNLFSNLYVELQRLNLIGQ